MCVKVERWMDRLLPMLQSLVVSLPLGLSYFSYAVYSSITDAVAGVAGQVSHLLRSNKLPLQISDIPLTNPSDQIPSIDSLMYDDIKPKKRKYKLTNRDGTGTELETIKSVTG